jgi:hypothetical protein
MPLREQTREEQEKCFENVKRSHILMLEIGNQFALERAWRKFLVKGVLPAILILSVIAFWTFISTSIRRAVASYFHWLQFGSTKSDSENTSNEP